MSDERWQQLLESARAQCSVGGYAGISMRTVAAEAGMSTATLYRHFSSKAHLLVNVLAEWLQEFDVQHCSDDFTAEDPTQRLARTVDGLTTSLHLNPFLADAVGRALVNPERRLAAQVEDVRDHLSTLFAEALGGPMYGSAQAGPAALLSDVLLIKIVAVAQGRISPDELRIQLARTVRLIVDAALATDPADCSSDDAALCCGI